MQDENTKRSGARLTSLLTVFAVLICMLSLMILSASAASEPTAKQFYGVWTPHSGKSPSDDLELTGLYFLVADELCNEFSYDSEAMTFEWNFNGVTVHSSLALDDYYVFDFGNTPVEIPDVLFEFFVENFDYTPSSYVKITANGGQIAKTENIFDVFSGIGSWIAGAFNTITALFYSPASGLTFLGVLAVCGLGLSVIFLLMCVIQRFLHFSG